MEPTCPRCGKFCSSLAHHCDVCGLRLEKAWKQSPPVWFRVLHEVDYQVATPKPSEPGPMAQEVHSEPQAMAGAEGFAGGMLEAEPGSEELGLSQDLGLSTDLSLSQDLSAEGLSIPSQGSSGGLDLSLGSGDGLSLDGLGGGLGESLSGDGLGLGDSLSGDLGTMDGFSNPLSGASDSLSSSLDMGTDSLSGGGLDLGLGDASFGGLSGDSAEAFGGGLGDGLGTGLGTDFTGGLGDGLGGDLGGGLSAGDLANDTFDLSAGDAQDLLGQPGGQDLGSSMGLQVGMNVLGQPGEPLTPTSSEFDLGVSPSQLQSTPQDDGVFDLGSPGPSGGLDAISAGGDDFGLGLGDLGTGGLGLGDGMVPGEPSDPGGGNLPGSDGVFDLGGGGSEFDLGGGLDLGGDLAPSSPGAFDLSVQASQDGVFDLGMGGESQGMFSADSANSIGMTGSLPGLDLGAAGLGGLEVGGESIPGLDLGGTTGLQMGVEGGGFDLDAGLGADPFGLGNPLESSIPGMGDLGSSPQGSGSSGGGGEYATLAFDPSASRGEFEAGAALDFGSMQSDPDSGLGAASAPEVDFSALADGADLGGPGPSSGEVDFSSLSSIGDQTLGDNPFESMSFADFSSADLGGATGEVDFSAIADGASLEGLENSMDFSGLSSLEFVPPPPAGGGGFDLDDNAIGNGDEDMLKASLLNYNPPK